MTFSHTLRANSSGMAADWPIERTGLYGWGASAASPSGAGYAIPHFTGVLQLGV